jgi:hypothetical protein
MRLVRNMLLRENFGCRAESMFIVSLFCDVS